MCRGPVTAQAGYKVHMSFAVVGVLSSATCLAGTGMAADKLWMLAQTLAAKQMAATSLATPDSNGKGLTHEHVLLWLCMLQVPGDKSQMCIGQILGASLSLCGLGESQA